MGLEKYRRFLNMSQTQMAKIAGIGLTSYSLREKGIRPFRQDEMYKIYKEIKREFPEITIEMLFFKK